MHRESPSRIRRTREAGMSMIELMIAMVVLAIGLGALSSLFVLASATDNKNSRTTSSTLLAQKVIEQINAQNANVGTPITMTDCAGNQWNVLGAGGAAPIGAGATLSTNAASPYYGGVDPTQGFGTVPNGYGMQYVDCAVNGRQGVYDVRWNVITLNQYARMITVTARQLGPANRLGNKLFAMPVTLRTIGGM